jgi:hypothetical protein
MELAQIFRFLPRERMVRKRLYKQVLPVLLYEHWL